MNTNPTMTETLDAAQIAAELAETEIQIEQATAALARENDKRDAVRSARAFNVVGLRGAQYRLQELTGVIREKEPNAFERFEDADPAAGANIEHSAPSSAGIESQPTFTADAGASAAEVLAMRRAHLVALRARLQQTQRAVDQERAQLAKDRSARREAESAHMALVSNVLGAGPEGKKTSGATGLARMVEACETD